MGVSRGDEEVEPPAWMRLSGRKHVKRGGPGTLTLAAVSVRLEGRIKREEENQGMRGERNQERQAIRRHRSLWVNVIPTNLYCPSHLFVYYFPGDNVTE